MSEEAGGVVSFRDVKEERGIWCVGGEAQGMPVTLGANDTKGGDQEGVCSTCRCGAGVKLPDSQFFPGLVPS